MTAPLHHYFIYTGHNSYLTGNQLSSYCSVEPIIKALQRGVRVIELDLWPNPTKDDIDVLHGRTLTTPVPLIDCLKSIKEYAFVKSPYPVIITLEDHLTPDLEAIVAKYAIETFGETLYYPQSESLTELPSPESLKNRILLSTKPPLEYLKSGLVKEKGNLSEQGMLPDTSKLKADELSDTYIHEQEIKSRKNGAPEYTRLIALRAGKPKKGLQEALKIVTGKVKRLSLSETGLDKAAAAYGTDLVRFTQKNVLRIYPKGTRVTSSNYQPINGWMHGAQMVALNMQGYGQSLWVMHGMFRSNGGCGYVKKPEFLMRKGPNNEVYDPNNNCLVKKTLMVKVYMADGWALDFSPTDFDMYSPPDFYTKARYFFQQLISGVSYCHTMQICHRDLKLENTLLDGSPAPRLKICDFGYSKSSLLHSRPKSTVGTPAEIRDLVLNEIGLSMSVFSCSVIVVGFISLL